MQQWKRCCVIRSPFKSSAFDRVLGNREGYAPKEQGFEDEGGFTGLDSVGQVVALRFFYFRGTAFQEAKAQGIRDRLGSHPVILVSSAMVIHADLLSVILTRFLAFRDFVDS